MSGKNTVGTLTVEVQMELAQMQGQIDTLNRRIKTQTAGMNREWKNMAKFAKAQIMSILPALSTGAIVAFTKSLVDGAGQLVDTAAAARMSVEQFQVLAYEARQSGVQIDQLQRSATTLAQKIEDAANGSKEAQISFDVLGLSWAALRNMAPERQFEEIGKAILKSNNSNEAFSASMDLLGSKNAPKMLEMLKRLGAEGFDEMARKARAAGQVLDEYTAKTLDDLGDRGETAWNRVKNAASGALVDMMHLDFEALIQRLPVWMGGRGVTSTPLTGNGARAAGNKQLAEQRLFETAAVAAKKYRVELEEMQKVRAAALDMVPFPEIDGNVASGIDEYQQYIDTEAARLLSEGPKIDVSRGTDWLANGIEDLNNSLTASDLRELREGAEAFERSTQQIKQGSEVLKQQMGLMWENVADRASEAFAQMVMDGENAFDALAEMVLRSMVEISARLAIINPLMNLVFSGFTGYTALPTFFSGRAVGGPVSAGRPYLVGEEGPELMVPNTSGTIVPNGQFGGAA
ncbi:MAG: hypothetical protein WC378_15650, partial [Opitutaceae bacterium]